SAQDSARLPAVPRMDAWHRRPNLCCAAVPNKPRRLLDWSAPCACRRTAALRHNERQQAFPGQAFETDTRENLHGEKEVGPAGDPARPVQRDAATRHDHVDM